MEARCRPWIAAMAVLATFVLGGCGPVSGQADGLALTAQNVSKIRSGSMDMRLTVGGPSGGDIGFQERGRFALPGPGALPVAQLELVHFVGPARESTAFISTGKNVYIGAGGKTYQLPAARADRLRQGGGSAAANLSNLQLDRWTDQPVRSDGGMLDGVASDHYAGKVNVRNFLNDLVQLSRGLGAGVAVPQVSDAESAQLSQAVKSSTVEAWSGREDHYLRRLLVDVEFAAPAASAGAVIQQYSQTHIRLELSLTGVNSPVSVPEPSDAQPFEALCAQKPDAPACKSA